MPLPSSIKLGPLTAAVLDRAVWREKSVFPAHQEWADEAERVLSFLESHGVLETLMSRLTAREWEGAFAEPERRFSFTAKDFVSTSGSLRPYLGVPETSKYSGATPQLYSSR